jgi:cytochrome c oxidase subunit II
MATPEAPAASAPAERNHGLRIFLIWLPLMVIADVLIWTLWRPHMPPGTMTESAEHQQFDIAVMAVLCAPVLLFIWVYAAYALINWRHRAGDEEDGPPIHGNAKIQATWIGATAVIVLGLFVFGTVELIVPAGAGAGEGPAPIWKPSTSHMLEVQVIGQQWAFTYRWPQFGGMETSQLLLPANTTVEFHVTSLDVIHSFWAYQLGVKADANPGVDNVAYTTTKNQLGNFTVRCNELCGLWHGAMFNTGYIVRPAAFQRWASGWQATERRNGLLAALPPYAPTYDPTVIPQLGASIVKIDGITGAAGYYYPPQDPVTP